jgi:hypothetical protein
VLFCHGRRFNGYHVRFRDIARGGLRLVTPASTEQLSLESGRQFDECVYMRRRPLRSGMRRTACGNRAVQHAAHSAPAEQR